RWVARVAVPEWEESERALVLREATIDTYSASASWLFSFVRWSSRLASARRSFVIPAKKLLSARCQKFRENSSIRQRKPGPGRAKLSPKNLWRRRRRRNFSQRSHVLDQSYHYGQTQIRDLPTKLNGHAAGCAVHHRQRSGRAFLLLRHEVSADRLHGAFHLESIWCAGADESERGVHGHALFCLRRLFPSDSRRNYCRRLDRQVLDHSVAFD